MLSLRSGDSTARVRMDAMNVENMKEYFDLLREVYDEYESNSHPECINNMDEMEVPLQPRPPKVIAKRGQKKDPILNFWAESADNSHWMWQCNQSNNPPLYHLCCQAVKSFVDPKRSRWFSVCC